MTRSESYKLDGPGEQDSAANGVYKNTAGDKMASHSNPSYIDSPTEQPVQNGKAGEDGSLQEEKTEKDKKKEKPPAVGIMEMFRFADKIDWLFMFLGTIGAIGNGISLPSLMIILGEMTDSFIDDARMTANWTDTEPINLIDDMKEFAYYYVAIGFAVVVVAYVQVTFWLMASYRQTQRIRILLFRCILKQEIGWFDTNEVGELSTRISDDVNKIQEGIGDKLSNFVQWTSCCIAGITIGFVYGWKLALVILAVGPLLVISGGLMGYLTTSFTDKELAAYAKAGAVAEEVLSAIRTVTAFGGQQKECQRYNKNLIEAKKFGIRKGALQGVSLGLMFFIIFGSYSLAFWYGSKLTREEPENYSGGQMMIVFFSMVFGTFALGNAAPNLTNFGVARGAAFTIFRLIDRESLIDSSSKTGKKPTNTVGNVEFRNVVFRYPSRPEVPILNGLNLQINVGQTVALVGASGCGKSTTVQLIQRFYDPLEGSVCIDGTDIRELNIQWLRQHIGVVSQEPVLFATTIGENIRYGRDGVTQKEIEAAANNANAHDFIMKLPQKYETLVGERGAQLSGGQKQRVAIARALVRDPKILLLDEATSALDTESESTVQAALDKAREGRTTIVVAHRLSTIRNADVIVGFRDGAAAENGTHEELMEKQGIYYTLVTNQTLDDGEDEEVKAVEVDRPIQRAVSARGSGRKLTRGMSIVSQGSEVAVAEEEKPPEVSVVRILKMNSPEWLYIVIGCIAATVNGASQPAFAILFSEIIGVFAEPDLDKQKKDVMLYSILFLVIGFAQGLANFFQALMFWTSGECLTLRLREITFRAMLRQEIGYFDLPQNSTGALTTKLATDASAVQATTGARLGTITASIANIGAAFVIGFYYSWKLALVTVAFLPLVAIGGMLQMKVMQGYAGGNTEAQEGAGKVATEAIGNIRTVAALTKEEQFVNEYERLTRVPYRSSMGKSHLYGLSFSISQAVIFFAYAAIFSFGAKLIKDGELNFEEMFKVFAAIVFGAMALGQAASFAPDYGKGKLAAGRIFHLVDREPDIDTYSETGNKMSHVQGSIEFRSVKFCYPSRPSVVVLKELSFQAQPGQMVALVGSSGCGKSTTVQLLERFYDPAEGQVMIDGQDLTGLNVQWLRAQLGLVQQEPILFDCSIRENIAYGDNSRDVPMDEIIAAARNANIHNFIDSLPNGYETNVGDKGAQLSGGQKQRVAIARALVRQPKILLLDEATSALDTESEKVVQEALDRAQEGRTSLVIAHRLSTIYNADCIIVFHLGQIAEIGTHSELMAHKGIYYTLNTKQQKQKQN